MIFLSQNKQELTGQIYSYETGPYVFYWMGFIYYPGFRGGEDSIDVLLRERKHGRSWEALTAECMGHFVLVIHEQQEDRFFIGTDPSGMFQCYYSGEAFSTHFLTLATHLDLTSNDISYEAAL